MSVPPPPDPVIHSQNDQVKSVNMEVKSVNMEVKSVSMLVIQNLNPVDMSARALRLQLLT